MHYCTYRQYWQSGTSGDLGTLPVRLSTYMVHPPVYSCIRTAESWKPQRQRPISTYYGNGHVPGYSTHREQIYVCPMLDARDVAERILQTLTKDESVLPCIRTNSVYRTYICIHRSSSAFGWSLCHPWWMYYHGFVHFLTGYGEYSGCFPGLSHIMGSCVSCKGR